MFKKDREEVKDMQSMKGWYKEIGRKELFTERKKEVIEMHEWKEETKWKN